MEGTFIYFNKKKKKILSSLQLNIFHFQNFFKGLLFIHYRIDTGLVNAVKAQWEALLLQRFLTYKFEKESHSFI